MCKFTIALSVLAGLMFAVVVYVYVANDQEVADVAVGALAGVVVGLCAYAVHVCNKKRN